MTAPPRSSSQRTTVPMVVPLPATTPRLPGAAAGIKRGRRDSEDERGHAVAAGGLRPVHGGVSAVHEVLDVVPRLDLGDADAGGDPGAARSEEHTSELQSPC